MPSARVQKKTEFHLRSELFTVRLWREYLGDGRVEWRGKVQHVTSGEARYFRDWPMLVARIQEILESDLDQAR